MIVGLTEALNGAVLEVRRKSRRSAAAM